jgi:predicted dehydrogenase
VSGGGNSPAPRTVRWGVLGAARIATAKVIPAMQRGEWTCVEAIASRDRGRAERAAAALGIPRVHDSYEDLIADPAIEAVYIPLPNHMHVPWTRRAAEAGKHVLCEKPIALTEGDVHALVDVRNRTGVKIQEAFMVRTHPQWIAARELARGGRIGDLRAMLGVFSYRNTDPSNIRNIREYGGGALLDIGCYFVMTSRFVFGEEPRRVVAAMERDARVGIDRLTSMTLEYPSGTMVGTCSTQSALFQRIQFLGTEAALTIETPFNPLPDRACRLYREERSAGAEPIVETIEIPPCDQFTIQGDLFSRAIREGTREIYPLEESLGNMRVIDALFRSAAEGGWVALAG